MDNLAKKTIVGLIQLFVGFAIFLFVPAGTIDYWQAWLYIFVYFVASAFIMVYLWRNDRKLLERRMRGGPRAEVHPSQKIIMAFLSLTFLAGMVIPALDRRFGWSHVPVALVFLGDALIVLGYCVVFLVFRENSFAAATVVVSPEQKVISTGPYAVVRHPMYAGALPMLFGSSLALGSYWGLLVWVVALPALIWRLTDEEKILVKDLPGYVKYCQKVRYRLVPYVY
jgi:protein-S-isoprenylcysteine O-methyltransferase Ste14